MQQMFVQIHLDGQVTCFACMTVRVTVRDRATVVRLAMAGLDLCLFSERRVTVHVNFVLKSATLSERDKATE